MLLIVSIAVISYIANTENGYLVASNEISRIQNMKVEESAKVTYKSTTGALMVNNTGAATLVLNYALVTTSGSTSAEAISMSIAPGSYATATLATGATIVGVVSKYGDTFWSTTSSSSPPTLWHMVAFTSSTTWTIPTGVTEMLVEVWGGGGGGCSGGGAGGGYGAELFSVSSGSYSITIGAGGTSCAAGGTTSFGSLISATGGSSGQSNNNCAAPGLGGTSSATFNIRGQTGTPSPGCRSGAQNNGGDSGDGGDGGSAIAESQAGENGVVPGGGGAGLDTYTSIIGLGASGEVLVYYN